MRHSPFYFLRHGALPLNPERRFVGQRDISLSDEGRQQMLQWHEALVDTPLTAVVTSDLARCVESARICIGRRQIPLFREPGLREISLGAWEGLSPVEVEALFPGAYAERKRDIAHFRPPGGESFRDLSRRVCPVVDAWVARMPGHVLFVAHAGVNRVILARHLAMPLDDVFSLALPYGALFSLDIGDF